MIKFLRWVPEKFLKVSTHFLLKKARNFWKFLEPKYTKAVTSLKAQNIYSEIGILMYDKDRKKTSSQENDEDCQHTYLFVCSKENT